MGQVQDIAKLFIRSLLRETGCLSVYEKCTKKYHVSPSSRGLMKQMISAL